MWVRGIIGAVLCVVGVVWIAQGTNVMHGSGMSGHGVYAVLGAVAFVIGAHYVGVANPKQWSGLILRFQRSSTQTKPFPV